MFCLTVFFSASISQLRDWICLLDSLASCLACLRESVLRFADSVRSANCGNKSGSTQWHNTFLKVSESSYVVFCVCQPTLDLYQSSDSCMFFRAMVSYWALMSLSAPVRSGLAVLSTSIFSCWVWTLTCTSWISWWFQDLNKYVRNTKLLWKNITISPCWNVFVGVQFYNTESDFSELICRWHFTVYSLLLKLNEIKLNPILQTVEFSSLHHVA